jgi:hypothetical protein
MPLRRLERANRSSAPWLGDDLGGHDCGGYERRARSRDSCPRARRSRCPVGCPAHAASAIFVAAWSVTQGTVACRRRKLRGTPASRLRMAAGHPWQRIERRVWTVVRSIPFATTTLRAWRTPSERRASCGPMGRVRRLRRGDVCQPPMVVPERLQATRGQSRPRQYQRASLRCTSRLSA